MKIENNTPTVTHTIESNQNIFDFGTLKLNQEAKLRIKVLDKVITKVKRTCGCSTAESEGNDITVQYNDTHKPHNFSKIIEIFYNESGAEKKELIKIKGKIV